MLSLELFVGRVRALLAGALVGLGASTLGLGAGIAAGVVAWIAIAGFEDWRFRQRLRALGRQQAEAAAADEQLREMVRQRLIEAEPAIAKTNLYVAVADVPRRRRLWLISPVLMLILLGLITVAIRVLGV